MHDPQGDHGAATYAHLRATFLPEVQVVPTANARDVHSLAGGAQAGNGQARLHARRLLHPAHAGERRSVKGRKERVFFRSFLGLF